MVTVYRCKTVRVGISLRVYHFDFLYVCPLVTVKFLDCDQSYRVWHEFSVKLLLAKQCDACSMFVQLFFNFKICAGYFMLIQINFIEIPFPVGSSNSTVHRTTGTSVLLVTK